MKNSELVKIYEESYKNQYNEFYKPLNDIYEKAIDKPYAIKMQLGIINFLGAFIIGNELDKKIIDHYEHSVKLGANIKEIIQSIPNTVEIYKQQIEINETKNETSIEWKRFLGIPYKIKKITTNIQLKSHSYFEFLKEENEIAEQLGKQRAVIDIKKQVNAKFIENGGLNEMSENDIQNIFPIEYKSFSKLKESLEKNDLVEFFKILQTVFASLSYDIKITEGYFHSHIHLILKLLDFEIHSEVETNQGRIDSVIETKNYIHILEFKHNNSDVALEQITNKKYYEKYLLKNKKIILVGIAVDKKMRNIIDWKMKTN